MTIREKKRLCHECGIESLSELFWKYKIWNDESLSGVKEVYKLALLEMILDCEVQPNPTP